MRISSHEVGGAILCSGAKFRMSLVTQPLG
jgi:hypothetical protein